MNPLLFANLRTQRNLLESGTAYATARLVLNIAFILAGIAGVLCGFLCVRMEGEGMFGGGVGLSDELVWVLRVMCVLGVLAYLAGFYVAWVAVQAFFDIADACLAISLQGPERSTLPTEPTRAPRQGGGNWPEPPKPLIPTSPVARPEDAKYMPKG